jgi:hypothetical protein
MGNGKTQVLEATFRTDTSLGRPCFASRLFQDAVLTTEPIYSRIYNPTLMMNSKGLCKISGFHGGEYNEWRLLGCSSIPVTLMKEALSSS